MEVNIQLMLTSLIINNWWTRKKSTRDGKVKSSKSRRRKSWGMRHTYRTPQWRGMQRNADIGLFTKPSIIDGFTKAITCCKTTYPDGA